MSEHHIIIKPIHTAIISLGFITVIVSASVFITSLRKDVDYQRVDINNLTAKVASLEIKIDKLANKSISFNE
jgi:hypothetical protein